MLSMINPDSMTRFDSQQKFSTHEGGFYDHHHPESPEKKSGKHSTLNFPAQKTMANFYPGPLGSVEERAGVSTAQGGSRQRPISAKIKKNGIPVSLTENINKNYRR
jgi:hypothetical protein